MRAHVLEQLAGLVPEQLDGWVRVGVDGTDGSGKTVLADELAAVLRAEGRAVVRGSIDDFHHVRALRYARGRTSPEGFYRDSFDVARFRSELVDPFGAEGRYSLRGHDLATDEVLPPAWMQAQVGAVLLVDGVFLHSAALAGCWDLSLWLDAPFDVTCARMAERDGTDPDPAAPGVARYVEGPRLYLAERDPRALADVVVDNSDLGAPRIVEVRQRAAQRRP